MFSFADKNALIIGAGHNIGRAIALEFARRGARVAVADIDKAGADETAALVKALGCPSLPPSRRPNASWARSISI
jgi:NAD(P)-dependent dehydrogenase (short-subunit alcohol dehydrogenase family)